MNTDKTQKHHPSVYGSWQIIGASAAKEEVTETYDAPPSVPQDIQDTEDDDLRELDRILAEEDEQPEARTYDSDDSLEALDSVIKDLKKKSKVPDQQPKTQDSQQSGLDVQYLLDQEEPVDLTELERKLFGGTIAEDDEAKSREPTLDEIEYTYLENLEKQYQQQKHASESGSNNLDEIRKLMDGWDERGDGGETGRHKKDAAKQHKDS